jgi:hypothetical protein
MNGKKDYGARIGSVGTNQDETTEKTGEKQ